VTGITEGDHQHAAFKPIGPQRSSPFLVREIGFAQQHANGVGCLALQRPRRRRGRGSDGELLGERIGITETAAATGPRMDRKDGRGGSALRLIHRLLSHFPFG
jgi:hypothetical protein